MKELWLLEENKQVINLLVSKSERNFFCYEQKGTWKWKLVTSYTLHLTLLRVCINYVTLYEPHSYVPLRE